MFQSIRTKSLCLFLTLFSLTAFGQKPPAVHFNHFYLVIDSSDLSAINHSDFIKNEFAAFTTRTTHADSGDTWTGSYFFGLDNYFEIFDSSGVGEPSGNAGMGFSVDSAGEINMLDSVLKKKYQTELSIRERQFDDKKIPWFTTLDIVDSAFFSQSHISLWFMEYKPEYFAYNHFDYRDHKLTRLDYLKQYESERKNKILKRFTGITFKATDRERAFFSNLLVTCGYRKIDEAAFASPDNFIIRFINRDKDDRSCVASVDFESNVARNDTVEISSHVQISFHNNSGRIIFN